MGLEGGAGPCTHWLQPGAKWDGRKGWVAPKSLLGDMPQSPGGLGWHLQKEVRVSREKRARLPLPQGCCSTTRTMGEKVLMWTLHAATMEALGINSEFITIVSVSDRRNN